jgi:hypothetical protein
MYLLAACSNQGRQWKANTQVLLSLVLYHFTRYYHPPVVLDLLRSTCSFSLSPRQPSLSRPFFALTGETSISPCRSADQAKTSKEGVDPCARCHLSIDAPSLHCINCQANMRTTNLFRFGILAFPTLALTSLVYIYVDNETRDGAKVTGKLDPEGETLDTFFGDQSYFKLCSNSTNFLTFNSTGRDLQTFAGIATIIFDAGHSDPRHLDISMPGYDLSVRTKAHVGHNRADTAVQHDGEGSSGGIPRDSDLGGRIRPVHIRTHGESWWSPCRLFQCHLRDIVDNDASVCMSNTLSLYLIVCSFCPFAWIKVKRDMLIHADTFTSLSLYSVVSLATPPEIIQLNESRPFQSSSSHTIRNPLLIKCQPTLFNDFIPTLAFPTVLAQYSRE